MELFDKTISEMSEMLNSGKITSEELVNQFFDRIDEKEGDINGHYCLECESDYMFRPGANPKNDCIAESSYYYTTAYGQIKSMEILQCPEEAKYLIKNRTSCIYKCEADSTYKWLYNGNCVDD